MRRIYVFKLRMTKSERDNLFQIAKNNGFYNVSSYIRWCLMLNLNKEIQEIKFLLGRKEENENIIR